MSDSTTTHETAKAFIGRYGDKAVLEVAQRERQAREAGKGTEAKDWHRVREALESMKGPPAT